VSGGRVLDDLARALTEEMPRRRALRLLGGALAAVVLPGARPGGALGAWSRAAGCEAKDSRLCPRLVNGGYPKDAEVCCGAPARRWSCQGTILDPVCVDLCEGKFACVSTQPDASGYRKVSCCDSPADCGEGEWSGVCLPCLPGDTRCGKECCPKGQVCRAGKCVGTCPPERSGCGLCCAPGQYCDRARGRCCPPDQERSCRVPESQCKEKVDGEVAFYEKSVCRRSGKAQNAAGMRESAFFSLGCFALAEGVMRREGYGRCRQETRDELCPQGVGCDPASGLCMAPRCLSASGSVDSVAVGVLSGSVQLGRGLQSLGGAVSSSGSDAVRAVVRKQRSVLTADAARVDRALGQRATVARSRALAKALRRYRADVEALRVSVERLARDDPASRAAAAPTLVTLGYASAGLESFAAGVAAGRKVDAVRHGKKAERSFKAAAVSSRKARSALGCGAEC
jgi:hypothetical protein